MKTRLRELRRESGLTQLDLQKKTGISQDALSRFETGDRVPPIPILLKLADLYGVSIDYILFRTEERTLPH